MVDREVQPEEDGSLVVDGTLRLLPEVYDTHQVRRLGWPGLLACIGDSSGDDDG